MEDGTVSAANEKNQGTASTSEKKATSWINALKGNAHKFLEDLKNSDNKPENISRRDFLKRSVAVGTLVGGALAVGSIPEASNVIPKTHEKVDKSSSGLAIIDTTSETESYAKNMLSQLPDGEDTIKRMMVEELFKGYLSHGEKVSQVAENVLKSNGIEAHIPTTQLKADVKFNGVDEIGNQKATFTINPDTVKRLLKNNSNDIINLSFQIGDVDLTINEYSKQISREKEEEVEQKYRLRSPKVWSFSNGQGDLADGYVGYDESQSDPNNRIFRDANGNEIKPITDEKEFNKLLDENRTKLWKEKDEELAALPKDEIRKEEYPSLSIGGAYTKEKAEKNVPKLFEICKTYPDKLFIAAVGNRDEDIREVMRKLADQRPGNLLMVAEWGKPGYDESDVPTSDVFGADIYVDNGKHKLPAGSSFSTPFISAYASKLKAQGLSMEEIVTAIKSASEKKTYRTSDGIEEGLVFDPEKLPLAA